VRFSTLQHAGLVRTLLTEAEFEIVSILPDWSIYGWTSYSVRFRRPETPNEIERIYRADQLLAALRNEPFDFVP
jgi:hypothetical protein